MAKAPLSVIEARGVHAALDLELGQIAAFRVIRDGRETAPFHRVPWAEEDLSHIDMPPHLRRMSVDFFCAPFGAADAEPAPFHGWSANSAWSVVEERKLADGATATYRLEHPVMGGTLFKTLTVRDDHPFLYQTHRFEGGAGRLPVAHHAMVSIPDTGLLSFSDKLRAETSAIALEPDPSLGASILRYPASGSLRAFPLAAGGSVDLANYPLAATNEDLALLVENPKNALGWSAAVRPEQNDMAILLKSPRQLPVTLLWYSNGGRFYAPWSRRHRGVLGMEEACSFFGLGHRASTSPNSLSEAGVATALALDGDLEIRTILGALPIAGAPSRVRAVELRGDELVIETETGEQTAPCDGAFLQP
jgi:hypothetical protein